MITCRGMGVTWRKKLNVSTLAVVGTERMAPGS